MLLIELLMHKSMQNERIDADDDVDVDVDADDHHDDVY